MLQDGTVKTVYVRFCPRTHITAVRHTCPQHIFVSWTVTTEQLRYRRTTCPQIGQRPLFLRGGIIEDYNTQQPESYCATFLQTLNHTAKEL